MPPKCNQIFFASEKQTCHREQHASSSNFKRRCERLHDNSWRSFLDRMARSSSLPIMLGIGSIFAGFIEDRISCAPEIAHNADLYGKRSRHWPMVYLISIFVWLALAWFSLSIGCVYWRDELRDETLFQIKEWLFTMSFPRSLRYFKCFSSAGCFDERRRRRCCWSLSHHVIFNSAHNWCCEI